MQEVRSRSASDEDVICLRFSKMRDFMTMKHCIAKSSVLNSNEPEHMKLNRMLGSTMNIQNKINLGRHGV